MGQFTIFQRFSNWREKTLDEKHFIYILSLFVGISSGLAAFILKNAVHQVHHFLTHHFQIENENYLYLAYPIVGIGLTVLFVNFLVKDNIGHGVSKILYALSKKKGKIKSHNNWTSIFASTLTIGFGGSVGAEAPIVLTGASLGSSLGRMFHLNHKNLMVLIGCGAAGAIAGIFKAPIAGLLFTMEVLMLDLTMASLIPLLISAVTAASLAYFLMGDAVLFTFEIKEPFMLDTIPWIIVLGIFCGFVSLFFTRGVMAIEGKFKKLPNPVVKWVIGGLLLSILIFFFPPLYGEGYDTIIALLNGRSDSVAQTSLFYSLTNDHWHLVAYLGMVLLFKVAATSATTASGGVGGIFAPTLFMGGIAGFMLAKVLNLMGFSVSESNFALVGMSGLMAGVMHAPLTAVFLIAEITGGYELFLPLMIVSTIAYLTIMPFEPHSIYHKRLAQRGELLTHHKDKAVLTLMRLESVIETDLGTISPNANLGELIKVISHSRRNIFPVVDEEKNFFGIVLLDDIRDIMFQPDLYENSLVNDLMIAPPATVGSQTPMDKVMKVFEESKAWNLPVVDEGKYVGFISKAKIFNAYRRVLVHFSDE